MVSRVHRFKVQQIMKLHEIQCHFREVPHAVVEYGLRPRRRPPPL